VPIEGGWQTGTPRPSCIIIIIIIIIIMTIIITIIIITATIIIIINLTASGLSPGGSGYYAYT
jgi:hypothetical protein